MKVLLDKLDQAVNYAYQNHLEDLSAILNEILGEINPIYTNLIQSVQEYSARGFQVPVQELYQQMQDMNQGIGHQDLLFIGDLLRYNIRNTVVLYKNICEIV